MAKFKVCNIHVSDYRLKSRLETEYKGEFKFESTGQNLTTLFWYPPSEMNQQTLELVKAFINGYYSYL